MFGENAILPPPPKKKKQQQQTNKKKKQTKKTKKKQATTTIQQFLEFINLPNLSYDIDTFNTWGIWTQTVA